MNVTRCTTYTEQFKHLMTVCDDMFGHGNTNGYLEYSSMTVRKHLFCVADGSGPLKPMFNLSIGSVDLMRVPI